jgi:hypothetical protein
MHNHNERFYFGSIKTVNSFLDLNLSLNFFRGTAKKMPQVDYVYEVRKFHEVAKFQGSSVVNSGQIMKGNLSGDEI